MCVIGRMLSIAASGTQSDVVSVGLVFMLVGKETSWKVATHHQSAGVSIPYCKNKEPVDLHSDTHLQPKLRAVTERMRSLM